MRRKFKNEQDLLEYRKSERERVKTYKLKYPEKVRLKDKLYRQKNKVRLYELQKLWKKNNCEKRRLMWISYRARKQNADGYCTNDQLLEKIKYYDSKCYICCAKYEQIDHVIPLSKGGTNWPANLKPICKSCNTHKGSLLTYRNTYDINKISPNRNTHFTRVVLVKNET